MEVIIALAEQFWQWTIVIALIIIGWIINIVDRRQILKKRVHFKFKEYPHMKPIRIPTQEKGFWSAIFMWLLGVRRWEIVEDFFFEAGFVFFLAGFLAAFFLGAPLRRFTTDIDTSQVFGYFSTVL